MIKLIESSLYKYTWSDGFEVITKLSKEEFIKRYNRLDCIRVIYEGFEPGSVGYSIYKKVLRAQNKLDNFTGIVKFTSSELDDMSFTLEENEFISDDCRDALRYYVH